MLDENDKKEMDHMIDVSIKEATGFSKRKVGDTPTDDNQLVPRSYVNMYGSIAGRPASVAATVGQQYFSTDNGFPIFFNTNNKWVTSAGSVIASN